MLKRKQLIRSCQLARLLATVFAKRLEPAGGDATDLPGSSSCPTLLDDELHPKRVRLTEHEPNATAQQEQKLMPETNLGPEPSLIRAEHGPKFMQLSVEQRHQLTCMHNNLGHPDATV